MGVDKSDPKRPDNVVPYRRPPPAEDTVDPLALSGMVLGMIGVVVKVRAFCFIALAFIMSAFIRRNQDTDVKQLVVSGVVGGKGLAGRTAAAAGADAAAAAGSL
ncbi:hypothetical protein GPECTOR_30g208 [Gonium pectorale]|uniref:Uncharacterized protein n=1 Tax=Gonium pectorale TaxID=33097 RepID=A0A150GEB0_GONPE|nr:hypothetical protein GPECTOR_30g208 [Gonium pectorale]|eukprot:KXZ48113.1 hypothetical protein GPECTOR_30g208 [Gonium pectorale]